eukprot:Nk52_evm2s345 gene=Nk52_evmTU2s345
MRDRMAELRQATGTTGNAGHTAVEMDTVREDFMSDFFEKVGKLRNEILESERTVQKINEVHGQALAAISDKQGKQCQEQLEQLKNNFNKSSNNIRVSLKEIQNENKEFEKKDPGAANSRVRKSQHAQLSRKFMNVVKSYNEIEEAFKLKYQERVKRQFMIVNPAASAAEVSAVVAQGSDANVFAQTFKSQTHAEARKTLEEVQDRHRDLIKIEKSLAELREMFADLALLVEQQGEAIDIIEHNVAQSTEYTEEAVIELKAAKVSMFRARRMKIYLSICCIILLVIIVLIIVGYVTNVLK